MQDLQVNQENLADQGSGLGYLEHVCQLIETIGQLHEQNKRLQRQVWGVERALSVNRMKEDFFLNHCSCGAVGIFESLTSLPDLQPGSSNVPMEQGSWSRARSPAQHTGCTGTQGDDGDRGGRGRCAKPICRKVASLEVELKYGRDRTRNLNLLHQGHQEAEAQTCGKFRVLVRKSGLKNQDTLQESSNMLKRSYPRLDRSEGGTCHSLMKDTNSTSALGLTRKSDWGNSH
ncbi:uncharacterized protein [Heptranchias perlo]|uniref:uncharacterized protein isoform X2 n=1 Tax=Heptranchias perlo TaxID=212740 RepID=UPI00355A78CA